MNWMTSGKHRALYSQRGRRGQMRFPSQVQRQRVKPTSPSQGSHPRARDSSVMPWYIMPIGDEDESQDIRVLQLERKGAMSAARTEGEENATETASGSERGDIRAASSSSQKRGREQKRRGQEERRKNRCIFTPVKKARKYEQPRGVAHLVKSTRKERPPSSIASGVELLFFNDGEELPHKNRAQRTKEAVAVPVLQDTRIGDNRNGEELQVYPHQIYREDNCSGGFEARQRSPDSENASFHDQAFADSRSEADQRDYQLWRINSRSCAGSSPDTAFSRPNTATFANANVPIQQTFVPTPPSSPFEASPLSFKMSRAEVLQSQLSTRVSSAAHDPLEHQMSFRPSPRSAPSPSTSTSSQGSIVLGRPPLGWQTKLMLAMEANPSDKPESHADASSSRVNNSPRNLVDSKLEDVQLDSPHSPCSSRGSNSTNSMPDAIIPVDAKERIMAAAASQHIPEHPQGWYPRSNLTKHGNTNEAHTVHCGKSAAFQQSWVMSSRTKTILDAVSSSKAPAMESAIQKSKTKHLEMESVAIYMYTLVQCYKIDEKLRFVHSLLYIVQQPDYEIHTHFIVTSADYGSSPVANLAQLPSEPHSTSTTTTLTKQTASRREIIFSPKRKP